MGIEKALEIQGWMEDCSLEWLAEQASCHRAIVEIGSWLGKSTRALAENTHGVVYAVDTWIGSHDDGNTLHRDILADKPEGWLFDEFKRNMEDLDNILIMKMTSLKAAEKLKGQRFDMIFIDASHNYEAVKSDILAWRPLLTDGGLFCGHDYFGDCGVTRAVNELLKVRPAVGSEFGGGGDKGMGSSIWVEVVQ